MLYPYGMHVSNEREDANHVRVHRACSCSDMRSEFWVFCLRALEKREKVAISLVNINFSVCGPMAFYK